jgi:hypothetical protein
MRYCNQCHHMTTGEPLFCNFCGSSYDVKLCPHRHVNPRIAQVCSECGSRDLSTPAPRVPWWQAAMLYLLSLLPGAVLLLVSLLFLVAFVQVIVTNQQLLFQFMLIALLLGLLWMLYMHLPIFIRRTLHSAWNRRKKDKVRH